MADTPKSSSPENPNIEAKKSMTFGDLYTRIQSESILTPEQEVALRKKAVDKYGMLGLIQKRKETIGDNTRTELEELLADMPGKSDILAKLEGLLPGKSKAVEVAQDATKKATEVAKEGIEKAKNLTPENMEAAVSKLGDKFSAGTAVLATAGAAVMAAPTIEGKAKALDGVMSIVGEGWDAVGIFFNNILAAIAALFSGKFSEALNKLKGAFGMGEEKDPKTLAEEAKKKGEKVVDAVKEEVKKSPEQQREELRTKSWESFYKKYSSWIKEGDKKSAEDKFKKHWDTYTGDITKFTTETKDKVMKGEVWNPLTLSQESAQSTGKFVIDLINDGVLPTAALKAQMMFGVNAGIQIGIRTVRSLVDSSTGQVDTMLGYLSGEDLSQLSPDKKKLLFAHFYHNMAFATWFAGRTAHIFTKATMLSLSWEHATGVNQGIAGWHTLTGDLDDAAKQIEKIGKLVGDDTGKAVEQIAGARKAMQLSMSEQITRLALTDAYLKYSGDPQKVSAEIALLEKDTRLNSDILKEFKRIPIEGEYKAAYSAAISNTVSKGHITTGESLKLNFKEAFGSLEWKKSNDEMRYAAERMNKSLGARILNNDSKVFSWYHDMVSAASTAGYAHYLDKGILPIVANDLESAKATMQRLQYQKLPSAIAGIFDSLSFLVITKHAIDEKSAATFAQDTVDLFPPYAAYGMLKEGVDIQDWRMEKVGYLAAGGALTGMSMVMLYQIAAANGIVARSAALANFVASPVMAAGRFATGSIQTIRLTGKWLQHAGTPTGVKALAELGTTLRGAGRLAIAGVVLVSIVGGYTYYQSKRDEEITADLKRLKIMKDDGSIDPVVLKTEFAGLSTDIKTRFYDQFSGAILGDVPHTSTFDSTKGVHTVLLKDPKNTSGAGLDQIEQLKSLPEATGIKTIVEYTKSAQEKITGLISSIPASDIAKNELLGKAGLKAA